MKAVFLVGILALAAIPLVAPTAEACNPTLCQPPVGTCVKVNGCSGGHDVCVYGFTWVPQCKDIPCLPECFQLTPGPDCQGCDTHVCVKSVTAADCGGYDVCITHGYEVPFCTDLPGISCGWPVCGPKPVSVCVHENACGPNHDDVCVTVGTEPPLCTGFTCACMPLQAAPHVPECDASCVNVESGPDCLQVYRAYWIGPGTGVVMRDSCHSEVYVDGERVLG